MSDALCPTCGKSAQSRPVCSDYFHVSSMPDMRDGRCGDCGASLAGCGLNAEYCAECANARAIRCQNCVVVSEPYAPAAHHAHLLARSLERMRTFHLNNAPMILWEKEGELLAKHARCIRLHQERGTCTEQDLESIRSTGDEEFTCSCGRVWDRDMRI